MENYENLPSPFVLLGAILRAWAKTKDILAAENIHLRAEDEKEFISQLSRLEDSGTLMMLGYIARAEEKTGRNGIMQARIVEALVPATDDPEAKDAQNKERQKVRQDIARRGGALKLFSLIDREELTQTAVEFSLTENGAHCVKIFEDEFVEELIELKAKQEAKTKGVPTCIAAE